MSMTKSVVDTMHNSSNTVGACRLIPDVLRFLAHQMKRLEVHVNVVEMQVTRIIPVS